MPTIESIYKILIFNYPDLFLSKNKESFDLIFFRYLVTTTEKNVESYFQQLLSNKKEHNNFHIPKYYYDERKVFKILSNNKLVLRKDIGNNDFIEVKKHKFFPFVRRIFFMDIMNHVDDLENFNIHWLKAIKSYKETCLKYFQQDNILEIYKEFYSFIKREYIDSEIQYLLKDIETLNMHIKNKTWLIVKYCL